MNVNIFAGAAIAVAALGAVRADAAMIIAAPVIVPFDDAIVTVTFESSEAAHTGNLYFLGSGDDLGLIDAAINSDATGLGQFLFANHNVIAGTSLLQGVFHAGDLLFFAYDVIAPEAAADDLFRSDQVSDRDQFAWETGEHGRSGTMFIEDLRLGEPGYDADYNDIVATITFTPVPSPGSLALMGIGFFVVMSKRRR